MRALSIFALTLLLVGCKSQPKTKLVYFGFAKHDETPANALQLAREFGEHPLCPHWRATLNREQADYQVLFGNGDVTIVDSHERILYSGGTAIMYLPQGNSNEYGIDICKLTD
jgi:hypothetical protein